MAELIDGELYTTLLDKLKATIYDRLFLSISVKKYGMENLWFLCGNSAFFRRF